ncbi:type IX secretion system membrane protein PorP/SprF [Subsaxibacter sp. CAU 1640]|uniref:PorP/SprF family type IX secretion system membrane protein n=1 Tax=Subsaxibacter sp. CAU 1640 TaxID=2933271 RepID=UPI002003E679|nr:type IX secretion system membrane protein PorP/SprF [Subsaxibacter sp. CAU 1640]MCK7590036.1 type IX secretion system membrane protein PorP/SprF [Subsaxibacter sp. CAU 1640]
MKHYILIILTLCVTSLGFSQQDAQYTQYMYNTQSVNPAYITSLEHASLGLLYRTQWVGFDGAPKTGTFTASTPLGELKRMGLGLSIVSDKIGPSTETNFVVDYSYALVLSDASRLSFGLKGGLDILDVDYTKLNIYDELDPQFINNVDKKFQPQIGAGVYFNTNKFYVGLSVPNFLNSKHYNSENIDDVNQNALAVERLHYFLIAGYVFDISENVKFKPATMFKAVSGSPLQADVSANFMFNEKFILGGAYRWDAAVSAMAGFQISDQFFIGMGYDFQTTDIEKYSDGSYEIFLRFDIFNKTERILTPRFF